MQARENEPTTLGLTFKKPDKSRYDQRALDIIKRMYNENYGPSLIAKELNKEKIFTPRGFKWTNTNVNWVAHKVLELPERSRTGIITKRRKRRKKQDVTEVSAPPQTIRIHCPENRHANA